MNIWLITITRSGSTTIWQIMNELMKHELKGHNFYRDHEWIPLQKIDKFITTIRDFRDVITSLWRVRNFPNTLEVNRKMNQKEIVEYYQWICFKLEQYKEYRKKFTHLELRAELFYTDYEYIYNNLEKFFDIKITRGYRDKLTSMYNLDANVDRSRQLNSYDTHDTDMVHGMHYSKYRGKHGSWKNYVFDIAYVNKTFESILKEWGYM